MAKQAAPSKKVNVIDLGWGYTKYSKYNPDLEEYDFFSFPSLAPKHVGLDLSLPILGKRDTVVVEVEGTKYEVGPDSIDIETNEATRNLNEQYIHTDQYKAVLLGALHYMKEPVIDLLVVGLPLSGMYNAEKLQKMVVGEHQINADEKVVVKDALVLPQPLGGLYYCLHQKDNPVFEDLKEEMNLVIDPGYLTFDFLLSNGDKVIENRSNAHAGGVSKVLRAVAESISQKYGTKYENLGAIDKGIRKGKLKINGALEDLEPHLNYARNVIEGSVNYMRNIVGDGSDIDNIILLGGGAFLFKEMIEVYYPNHKVLTVENSQLANAMGFQKAGEAFVSRG